MDAVWQESLIAPSDHNHVSKSPLLRMIALCGYGSLPKRRAYWLNSGKTRLMQRSRGSRNGMRTNGACTVILPGHTGVKSDAVSMPIPAAVANTKGRYPQQSGYNIDAALLPHA